MGKEADIFTPWECAVDSCKVAEFIVGTGRKDVEIANIVEFVGGCLQMCNLNGDLPTKWAYVGDTLTFYKQFYVAKPSFVPIRLN